MIANSMSTARLRGERITMEHFSDVLRMHQNDCFMKYLGGLRSESVTLDYLKRNIEHWDKYGFGLWILHDAVTSEIIGRGGLRHVEIDGIDEVGIGYGFSPEHWGNGFATEFALACVGIVRDVTGLKSIVADAERDNAASIRVMTKAGFVYERDITIERTPAVVYRRLLV